MQVVGKRYIITLHQSIFLLLRMGDDDATAERKVALLLETASKVKWKTAENVEKEKSVTSVSETNGGTVLLGVFSFPCAGLCS